VDACLFAGPLGGVYQYIGRTNSIPAGYKFTEIKANSDVSAIATQEIASSSVDSRSIPWLKTGMTQMGRNQAEFGNILQRSIETAIVNNNTEALRKLLEIRQEIVELSTRLTSVLSEVSEPYTNGTH
jgi:hypothetical protein